MASSEHSAHHAATLEPSHAADLYLAGSGSFAAEVAEWATGAGWDVRGLIELLDTERVGSSTDGYEIVGIEPPQAGARAVVAAGGSRRAHWSQIASLGWETASVVHPSAHLSPTAALAAGCIVAPAAVIGAHTVLREHTLVSRGALIGHHCRIDAFVSLMPGANIGGHAHIGEGATVGMGAVVVNGAAVGRGATVAAGAVVLGEVPDGARVQGVPARAYHG